MDRQRMGMFRFYLSALSLVVLFLFTSSVSIFAKEKIKIRVGEIFHVTGAYAAGQAGLPEAAADGFESANKYMNLPDNVEIEHVWLDGGTSTSKSLNAFKKMVGSSDPVVLMLSNSSPVGVALKTWHMRKKVPGIEHGSDNELFKLPSWTFSMPAPYVNQLGAWIDYYMTYVWPQKGLNRAPRFAWLTWDLTAGRASITDHAKEYIRSKGIELVDSEFVPYVPTNVSAQILRLKQNKVDFTFGMMYHNALAVILKEMDKQGLIDQIDVGQAFPIQKGALLKSVGSLARNVYVTGITPSESEWDKLCPRAYEMWLKNKRQNLPSVDIYLMGFSKAILASEVIRIAINDVGAENVTTEAVYNALQKIDNFDAWNSAPPMTWGEKKRFGMDAVFMYRMNDNSINYLGTHAAPNLTGFED